MLENSKDSIYMYTFYHQSGASVQVMELEGEGWILAPDILKFLGYEHPLSELEEVDEDDKRYIQGVPFINKYVFKRFAYQAQPKMDKTEPGPHYYFREEGWLRDFCYWVSWVAISAMRGTEYLPENDDEWSFHIWRKDECKQYMEKVRKEEGIVVEEDVVNQTITIPVYTYDLESIGLDSDQLLLIYKVFCDARNADVDLKGFINGFIFATELNKHWQQELIKELEEKPFELEA